MAGRDITQPDLVEGKDFIPTTSSTQIAHILEDVVQDVTAGRKKLVVPFESQSDTQDQSYWNIWDELTRELHLQNCSPEVLQSHRIEFKQCLLHLLRNAGFTGEVCPNCLDAMDVHEPNQTARDSEPLSHGMKAQVQEQESESPTATSTDDGDLQLSNPLQVHVREGTSDLSDDRLPFESNLVTGPAHEKDPQPQSQPSTKTTNNLQLLRALHAKERSDFETYALKRAARHHRSGNIAMVVGVIILLFPVIRVWIRWGWEIYFSRLPHSENATMVEPARFIHPNTPPFGCRST